MTADVATPLVWLAPQPPDAGQARSLAAWGRAHGLTFAPPEDARPALLPPAEGVTEAVDESLDRARDAITERDGTAADRALDTAEQALRAHPELPNAAWLMAEVERARSARFRAVPPTDPSAADRAWLRAEALDGGRTAGVGEQASATRAQAATLVLEPPAGERASLDGVPVGRGPVTTRVGPHALVVTWDGAPVWATWIDAGAGTSSVPLPSPVPPACSLSADMATARGVRGAIVVSEDVRCSRWVAATTGLLPDAVRIATCETGRCNALFDWREPPAWTWSPPASRTRSRRSAWIVGGAIGAGVAVAATVAAVLASGALKAPPAETRFVTGGLKTP